MKNEIVEFYGQQLITAKSDEGVEYVAMKPLCEALGLEWEPQRKRIVRDEVLKGGMVMMEVPTGKAGLGGIQKMVFIPLEYLNGWLFGVDVSRLKDEAIKEKIVVYKRECYRVLHRHWSGKSGSLEERVVSLERSVLGIAKSLEVVGESMKLLAENMGRQTTNVVMQTSPFLSINPSLGDNKKKKEEFVRSVIDILAQFEDGLGQSAIFHRIEFSQSATTRRWLHEGVGVYWDMYIIPGNKYKFIVKSEVVEANS